jgi:hypothetical protein
MGQRYLNDKIINPSVPYLALPSASRDLDRLCDRIFALDRTIRFAGVIDKMSKISLQEACAKGEGGAT